MPDDGGGLAEQVEDGKDGFVLNDVEAPASIARGIDRIQALDRDGEERIRTAGVESVFKGGYTWSSRILETLSCLDGEVASVKGEVLGAIEEEEKKALC